MKHYFIKNGYIINQVPITSEEFSEVNYWNKDRISASKYYQYSVYKDAIKLANECGAKTLCDVGCGTGEKLKNIHKSDSSLKIIGVDQSHVINYCLKNHNFGEWLVDDFAKPSSNFSSDITICSDVIEHLVDPDILLGYLKRITVPGGLILISTPDRDRVRGRNCLNSPNKQHIREWNFSEFACYLLSHGFILQKHYHAPAVKFSMNKVFFQELFKRMMNGKTLNYNQVALIINPG
jgi:SAM-dependent methyltransferase